MTTATQKRLAIAAAILGVALVIGANANLVIAAFRSQPDCAARPGAAMPARPAC